MTAKGFVVKSMTVTIGAVNYECEIVGLDENESHDEQKQAVACGDAVTDVGPSSFSIDITANAVLALSSLYYLLTSPANYGLNATILYAPDAVNNPTVKRTASVVLVPAGASYQVGSFAQFTVSLPCRSAPTWQTPPTIAADEAEPAAVA